MSAIQKFQRRISRNPQLLTCNSYMNFLRFYKTQHPRLGLRKILQNGSAVWHNLNKAERKRFKQKKAANGIRPRLQWLAKRRLKKLPRLRMPNAIARRQLTAKGNIKRRKGNVKRLQRYRPKRLPPIYK